MIAIQIFLFCQRNEDTYQGFIRVHMNLVRPINIIAGERPLSIFETVGVQREEDQKVSDILMVVNQLSSSKLFILSLCYGAFTIQFIHINYYYKEFRIG